MITVLDLIKHPEITTIKINGVEFQLQKFIVDQEFVTSGVTGFNDTHDYFIETDIDPQVIFDEVMAYVIVGDYEYIEEKNTYEHLYLKISPATSVFIDMFIKNRNKLLEWVCWTYSRKIDLTFDNRESGVLNDIIDMFCTVDNHLVNYRYKSTLRDVILKEFPDITDEIDLSQEECIKKIRTESSRYEMFLPRIIKAFIESYDIKVEHVIPNIEFDEPEKILGDWFDYEHAQKIIKFAGLASEYVVHVTDSSDKILVAVDTNEILDNKLIPRITVDGDMCLVAHKNNSVIKTLGEDYIKQTSEVNHLMYEACSRCLEMDCAYGYVNTITNRTIPVYMQYLNNGVFIASGRFINLLERKGRTWDMYRWDNKKK